VWPECRADGELAGAVRGTGDVESAEIDAGGEEYERGEEHEGGKKAAQLATEGVADETQRSDAEGGVGLVGRVFAGELLRDAVEISLRLPYGDARGDGGP
jgi:hypothetical protein